MHAYPTADSVALPQSDARSDSGREQLINEPVWKRQTSHNDARQGSEHHGRLHDVLLLRLDIQVGRKAEGLRN